MAFPLACGASHRIAWLTGRAAHAGADIFAPPFNIVRSSHITLGVADLGRSRAFYEGTLGLQVEDEAGDALFLRGLEERRASLARTAPVSRAKRAASGLQGRERGGPRQGRAPLQDAGHEARLRRGTFQGRTLRALDPCGLPLEFYFKMEQRPSLLRQYGRYKGVQPQRLDHFNVFAPEVQRTIDFYASLGFRLTEYAEEDGANARIAAAWMHRKGNVHDIAFTNGPGPRLHHLAYWVPNALDIIHLCDVMASTGYLANMERGPGRHGISNAFFLYVRCPDGHRTEVYTSDYQTMDPDHEPLRWSLRDPRRQTLWGQPAPRSCRERA